MLQTLLKNYVSCSAKIIFLQGVRIVIFLKQPTANITNVHGFVYTRSTVYILGFQFGCSDMPFLASRNTSTN